MFNYLWVALCAVRTRATKTKRSIRTEKMHTSAKLAENPRPRSETASRMTHLMLCLFCVEAARRRRTSDDQAKQTTRSTETDRRGQGEARRTSFTDNGRNAAPSALGQGGSPSSHCDTRPQAGTHLGWAAKKRCARTQPVQPPGELGAHRHSACRRSSSRTKASSRERTTLRVPAVLYRGMH